MGPTESKVVASVGSESVVLLVVLCLTSRRAPRESEVVVAIVPESVVVLVVAVQEVAVPKVPEGRVEVAHEWGAVVLQEVASKRSS